VVLYAICADLASNRADRVLGVFRSTKGGASWVDATTTAEARCTPRRSAGTKGSTRSCHGGSTSSASCWWRRTVTSRTASAWPAPDAERSAHDPGCGQLPAESLSLCGSRARAAGRQQADDRARVAPANTWTAKAAPFRRPAEDNRRSTHH